MAVSSSDARAQSWEPTVSSRVVRELACAVERAGIPRQRFFAAARLESDSLEAPDARLKRSDVLTCAEVALDLTADPVFGLHWAEAITASSFALTAQLLAHAPTLRAAFDALFQFGDLTADQPAVRVIERDAEVEVRFTAASGASPRLRRLSDEVAMLGLFRMLRDFSPLAKVAGTNFAYAAPDYRFEYTRLFEATERFEQPFTGLVFDRALLDLPSPHKDEDVEAVLRGIAARRLAVLRHRVPYGARVRELLLRESAPHRVTMTAIAPRLGVSLRSLHRRLVDEGQSFTALANEAAGLVAKRLLADEGRTIREVSGAMGFADANAFHRAFKRWTGTTPMKFLACR